MIRFLLLLLLGCSNAWGVTPQQAALMVQRLPAPFVAYDFIAQTCEAQGFANARAGSYWIIGSDGNYKQVAANTCANSAFDTTGAALGLAIWQSSGNSIRNNAMVGAAAGSPGTQPTNWVVPGSLATNAGTLAASVAALTTVNGIDTIDETISGTTAGAGSFPICFETVNHISAATAQVWAQQAFVQLVGGALTNVSSVNLAVAETATGTLVQFDQSAALTIATSGNYAASLQNALPTLSGGATVNFVVPCLMINYTGAVAINATLRIGWPLVVGPGTTDNRPRPPIRTAGTAAGSIQGDNISVSTSSLHLPSNVGEMLFVAKYMIPHTNVSGALTNEIDDGSNTNRIQISVSTSNGPSGGTGIGITQGGVTKVLLDGGISVPQGVIHCIAARATLAGVANAVDGGRVATAWGVTTPIAFTTLRLGRLATGNDPLDGYLLSLKVYLANPSAQLVQRASGAC